MTDAGPGFPPAFLERAFDRFSRADEARSRGGAGLGLSIVGLIAEAHGGKAGAANRPTAARTSGSSSPCELRFLLASVSSESHLGAATVQQRWTPMEQSRTYEAIRRA